MKIKYVSDIEGIDWKQMKADLAQDDFDNGRTPEQLELSFSNSRHVVVAMDSGRAVGTARVISDGVCNAYLVDVWTQSAYRKRGIATEIIRLLLQELPGQHVYLQADDDLVAFYTHLGFQPQPNGMFSVVGNWLEN